MIDKAKLCWNNKNNNQEKNREKQKKQGTKNMHNRPCFCRKLLIGMGTFKTIADNRKTLMISFLGVALFWGSSFLPELYPSLFSHKLKFIYFFSVLLVVIVVGVFGLVSLILIFVTDRKKRPPRKFAITGVDLLLSFIVLTPLTFAIHRYIPRSLPSGSNLRVFNSTLWQDESSIRWNDGISLREQMLKDVVENILPGKNKKEIEKLLGPSLETNYFKSIDKDLIYYLGPERDRLFNVDSEWFLIWLDENGKFKRYRIAND